MNYYNEFDAKAAAWLRELIKAGLIPDGHVDERSICDVQPKDLEGFTQCHFFAGIGGWPLALDLAGWPRGRPVWTGSCPCRPFSAAGQRKGTADERHLWPVWFALIRECRPECVIGEQVASAIGHGWLDGISSDLEGEGYACGAVVLGAHSVGAPHIRQRLYWMADAMPAGRSKRRPVSGIGQATGSGNARGLADAGYEQARRAERGYRENERDRQDTGRQEAHGEPGTRGEVCGLGDAGDTRLEGRDVRAVGNECATAQRTGALHGFWSAFDLLPCLDGKARRVESGTFPLAHGVPARVGRLRGYGNAIVAPQATEFIRSYKEVCG